MLKSLVTTVATPVKCAGPAPLGVAAQHLGEPAHGDAGGEALGVDLLAGGGEEQVDALALGQRAVAVLVARVGARSSAGPNWAGFTNRETTTRSHCSRARRMRDRWPSWKLPIVGTRPMERPARRSGHSAARRSATVRTTFTPAPPAASARVGATISSKSASSSGAAVGHGRALRLHGGLVSAGHRAGRGPLRAERAPVLHGAAHQREQEGAGLARLQARPGGHPLGGGLEGDQEVRGHRCGGVVGRTALVGDHEGAHAQPAGQIARRRRARRGWSRPRRAHTRQVRRPADPANVWSGWSPKVSAPARAAGASAERGVAPLVWPTRARRRPRPRRRLRSRHPAHRAGSRGIRRAPRPGPPGPRPARRLRQRRGQRAAGASAPDHAEACAFESVAMGCHGLPVHSAAR